MQNVNKTACETEEVESDFFYIKIESFCIFFKMAAVQNGIDNPYQQFLANHSNQLETSVVPQHFWPTLFKKLSEGVRN
jgi:hypothetical protein